MKKVKKIYLIWDSKDLCWYSWKTKKDAEKGENDPHYWKGVIGEICYLGDYVGFEPNRKKIYEVQFKQI